MVDNNEEAREFLVMQSKLRKLYLKHIELKKITPPATDDVKVAKAGDVFVPI